MGSNPIWLVSLQEAETWTHRETPRMDTQRRDRVRTQQEVSHLQAKEEVWEENKSADTLILDFQWENTVLLFKPPAWNILLWLPKQTSTSFEEIESITKKQNKNY